MLCSEERHNGCLTYGYINSSFQTLTSHRLSLSFYFIFMILSWWCFMSLCNELNGFLYHPLLYRISNPHGEQHKSCKKTTDHQCEIILQFFPFFLHKIPWKEDALKLMSLATIKDIVLFAICRRRAHYVISNYSDLCLNVKKHAHTYSQSPISLPSLYPLNVTTNSLA